MEIHRFDAEVSRPIDAFGSSFRLGDLLDARRARLAVLHLAAGGRPRRPADRPCRFDLSPGSRRQAHHRRRRGRGVRRGRAGGHRGARRHRVSVAWRPRRPRARVLRLPAGSSLPRHHLYLVVEHNKAHVDHWLLRDVLRADPGARDRYGALKRKNARDAGRDMDYYVAAKAAFVADLLAAARAKRGLPEAEYWVPDMARFGRRGPSDPTRQ